MGVAAGVDGAADLGNPECDAVVLEEREREPELVAVEGALRFADHDGVEAPLRGDPIAALTPREREVLALMAQGHDNNTIAARLVITDNAVHKHIGNIFTKLGLAVADSGHRRVIAVLTYLNGAGQIGGD